MKIRLSDGLIEFEYDETRPAPVIEGVETVRRASHIDPVHKSSPPRFVICWSPWLWPILQTRYTDKDQDGNPFMTYAAAQAYERQVLAAKYFQIDKVGDVVRG